MRIICTGPEDYKMALALADVARATGIQADVVCLQDAYALTIWSIDDVPEINDRRAKKMSAADKEEFMEFAQRQLKADMTERGWYSLGDLLDIFMGEKSDTDAPDV